MSLIHCIYASTASRAFAPRELAELLARARHGNAARDVSGILLHIGGNFFQVLEGEAATVDALFELIRHDPRHTRVTAIVREPIARRAFADWSMGFAEMTASDFDDATGLNDFFASGSCLDQLNPGRAKKLLTAFAAGRWRGHAPAAALAALNHAR